MQGERERERERESTCESDAQREREQKWQSKREARDGHEYVYQFFFILCFNTKEMRYNELIKNAFLFYSVKSFLFDSFIVFAW